MTAWFGGKNRSDRDQGSGRGVDRSAPLVRPVAVPGAGSPPVRPAAVPESLDQPARPAPSPRASLPEGPHHAVWRHEEKFLLNEVAFTRLYWQLLPFLKLDRHAILPDWPPLPAPQAARPGLDPSAGFGSPALSGQPPDPANGALAPLCQFPGYQVRSLYLDTIGRHALFEKLAGSDQRFKYRIRIYNNEDRVIHLEKKMKRNSYCLKESVTVSRAEVEALLAGDSAWLLGKGPLGQELYGEMRTRLMAPLVLVDYHRIPFIWQADEIRITFDRLLSSSLYRTDLFDPHAALHPVLAPGQVILEVKYNHFLPDFLRTLLSGSGMAPIAVSKYAMCCREITPAAWGDPQDVFDEPYTYAPSPQGTARDRKEWME